jgi:hypothetical protein
MVVLTKEKPMPSKGKRVIFGVIAIALIVTALVVGLRDGSDTQATPVQKTTENGAPPVETDSEATQAPPGKTPVEPKGHFESYWATYSVVCLCGLLVLVPRVRGWTSGVKRATVGVGKSGLGLVNQHTHGVPFWPRLFTLIGILLAIGVAVTFRIPSSEATKPVEAATAQTTPVDVPPAENVGEGAATDQQAVQPAEQVATPLATPQASGEIPNSLGKVVWQWITAQHWLTKVLGILLALGIAWALCTHKAGGERWRVIALRFVGAVVILAIVTAAITIFYRVGQNVIMGQLVGNNRESSGPNMQSSPAAVERLLQAGESVMFDVPDGKVCSWMMNKPIHVMIQFADMTSDAFVDVPGKGKHIPKKPSSVTITALASSGETRVKVEFK